MVDSVAVFPPGFRVLDANGDPVTNAKIKFHEAGPGDELTVYSDKGLADALGTVVRTRSDGYPCVNYGSNTTTLIYVGTAPYHVEITDENDQVIMPARDDVLGALDTSGFLTSADASTVRFSNVAVTAARVLGVSDNGKVFNCDPSSSGTFTIQFDLTTTLEDGWNCEVRHDGTANYVRLAATQDFYGPFGHRNAFSLEPGEAVAIRCTGGAFKVSSVAPPSMMATMGMIKIVDRISSAPASPNPRDRYIATAVFTTGGVTTAIGDIIEATGQGTYIKITPPSNCGWRAWVQSESRTYIYRGTAWAIGEAGTVINRTYVSYAANANLGVTIPIDDTIPQITEGTQILSATITPKSASNIIRIRFLGNAVAADTGGPSTAVAALFMDTDASALTETNALVAAIATVNTREQNSSSAYNSLSLAETLAFEFEHVPAVTTAITYTVRVGSNNTTAFRMNGQTSGRLLGGVSIASMVIEEIAQ